MCSERAKLGRLMAIALLGASAGCGGKVTGEGDPDAAAQCTRGVQAVITGELEGIPINAVLDLARAGLARRGERWAVEWAFVPLGQAIATGTGADGEDVDASLLFVTPQGPPFDGAIFTAAARLRVAPLEPAVLTALRRIGWCPGSPIRGELTFCSRGPGCPAVAAQPESALLFGHLDGMQVNEPGWVIYNVMEMETDGGVRRATNGLSNGGLALVEGPPESSAGVIAFPEPGMSHAVLCVDQLAEPPTPPGNFHATALSLAGYRPGEPVSGELSLRLCVDGALLPNESAH